MTTMPEWVHTFTVDASHVARLGITGIGIVVQERGSGRGRGAVVDQVSELHRDVPANACEAHAIRRALEIALERGYSRVKVRSDYNSLRRCLREHHRHQRRPTNPLHIQIVDLAGRFTWVDFGYVARRKNQLAHRLARAAWAPESKLRIDATAPEDGHQATLSSVRQLSTHDFDIFLADLLDDDDSDTSEIPF